MFFDMPTLNKAPGSPKVLSGQHRHFCKEVKPSLDLQEEFFELRFDFNHEDIYYHLLSNLNHKKAKLLLEEMSFCHQSVSFVNCLLTIVAKPSHNFNFSWTLLCLYNS